MPTGSIKRWITDKGFGFFSADDGTADVFAHVKQLNGDQEAMKVGQHEGRRITYECEMDTVRGKPKATSWAFLDAGAPVVAATVSGTAAPAAPGGAANVQALLQAAVAGGAGGVAAAGQGAGSQQANILNNLVGLVNNLTAARSPGTAPAPPPPQAPQPGVAQYAVAQPQYAQQQAVAQHVPQQVMPRQIPPRQVPPTRPAPPPPPPPAPVPQAQEEVDLPENFVSEALLGKAGQGLEEIKQRAGGDIVLDVAPATGSGGTRVVRIRGPAVSASLGMCLLLQKAAEAA